MNSHSGKIDYLALHVAIAAGARVTIVTPNRRLATFLTREYDDALLMAKSGARGPAWHSADILPLETFFERTYRARNLRAKDAALPQLLSAIQSQCIWEDLIRKSGEQTGLLSVPQAARLALEAWQMAHAWCLLAAMRGAVLHPDGRLFQSWAMQYQQVCREHNMIDGAVLPDFLATRMVDDALLPNILYTAGFDIITPQRQHFFAACAAAGVNVESVSTGGNFVDAKLSRVEFASEFDEFCECAAWARRRLEANQRIRIAIVVPDLRAKRPQVERALIDALLPGERAEVRTHRDETAHLFNFSLGQPLSDYALVHDALALLEFSQGRAVPYLTVSALLRSPYLTGAEEECAPRAALDRALREIVAPEISFFALQKKLALADKSGLPKRLANSLSQCGKLRLCIDRMAGLGGMPSPQASPQDWARHFARVLGAWGFPGEAGLDSVEYQVLQKFRDALDIFASLIAVKPRMRANDALVQLQRLLADTVFQAESSAGAAPPIQVLGILESASQQFDALWVTGLSDDAWPLTARPAPFIPAILQRNAGVPEASAHASLALDRRITDGWRLSAPEVIFSHARQALGRNADEQIRVASALIRDVAPAVLADASVGAAAANFARAAQACGLREPIPDHAFEMLPTPTHVGGGAAVIRDQAACPFQAFARHRLSAEPLSAPHAGLDAAERGTLLHRALYLVWGKIVTHASLLSLDETAREEIVERSVTAAITDARNDGVDALNGRFAQIEHTRLVSAIRRWLDYEAERAPFEVVERECKHRVTMAALAMNLRLDRLDRLEDGTHALIDYKTGAAKFTCWLGDRPDEPQLPLYFSTAEAVVSALAFARLKRGERGKVFGFEGVSAAEGLLPDVTPIEAKRGMDKKGYVSWDILTEEWETSLRALAKNFSTGAAEVDPKNGSVTCARCDLQSICRIGETSAYAADETGAGVVDVEVEVEDADGINDIDDRRVQ